MRSEEGAIRVSGKELLADIGNTHFHIYDGQRVVHLSSDEAIKQYSHTPLKYISVKHTLEKRITRIEGWTNISDKLSIEGEYETMGVDRKALCLSYPEGVFVDAGSAITVDVVEEGKYRGGYIFPGIKAMLESYARISPALETDLDERIDLSRLSTTTKGQISYGIIASIKTLIEKHAHGKPLYFTGGDGRLLAGFFEDAIYDETLVFKGIEHALQTNEK